MNNLIEAVSRRVRNTIGRKRLAAAQNRVFDTPPAVMTPARLNFVSMVSQRDIASYLCAIKSLYPMFGEGKVTVVNDGSLSQSDQAVIARHLPLSTIVDLASIDVGACPHGGCWERLVHVLGLTRDNYVIQVDSDTLTTGATPEILNAYRDNRSFLLGTDLGLSFGPVEDTARLVAGFPTGRDKIGCVAEMALPDLPDSTRLLYARGSAGFAGFAQGSFEVAELEVFSRRMQELVGDRWTEWGSEQIASNFMISNAKDAIVLPYAAYSCFEPWIDLSTRVFLHFYGTYRFHRGYYRKQVLAFIKRYGSDVVGGATNSRTPARP
ncbi:MAG: hypothetical protein ACRYGM_06930 [Janthinobacterium lividum]